MIFILILVWQNVGFTVIVGDKSPKFVLKTIDGQEVRSDKIKNNKPLFLVFWATWCLACKKEIPNLKKIYAEFKGKGLEYIAINVGINDSQTRVKNFMNKYQISYPVAFDKESQVTKRFKVWGVPTIFIIDKGGVVQYRSTKVPDDLAKYLK
jgi:peroxiredoxin